MKPFNLERALAGDKVITRDGREVTQLVHFKNVETSNDLFGVLEHCILSWKENGNYWGDDVFDLFMAPIMKPFDINAVLRGEKVVTRNGCEVTNIEIYYSEVCKDYYLRGVVGDAVMFNGGSWCMRSGKFKYKSIDGPNWDLFIEEPKTLAELENEAIDRAIENLCREKN